MVPRFRSWREAVEKLPEEIGPSAVAQVDLAFTSRLQIDQDLPKLIAGMRAALARELCLPLDAAATKNSLDFLEDLNPRLLL